MLTDVAGIRVGHWTDGDALTGCTVVLLPPGSVTSGEVRGGAPGTREVELLRPERLVQGADAVVLSGGSAFGLAACDGVVRWCEEQGIGFVTPAGPVPIVVGLVIYDLTVGDGWVRPTLESGYTAAASATGGKHAIGRVGAGTGATVSKWRGAEHVRPGGVGTATERHGDLIVSALVVVNAFGDVVGAASPTGPAPILPPSASGFGESTTVGVIATNADLDKVACLLVAQGGHDGLARALEPVHATVDGDALVTCAVGGVPAHVDQVRLLAARAVTAAVRSVAVRNVAS